MKFGEFIYKTALLFIVFTIAAIVSKLNHSDIAKWPVIVATMAGVIGAFLQLTSRLKP